MQANGDKAGLIRVPLGWGGYFYGGGGENDGEP